MPELPEVETVVRDLRPLLVGRRIATLRKGKKHLRQAWSPGWIRLVRGRRIEAIERRGKWILIHLGEGHLVIHLGMTGQLTVGPPNRPTQSHTHLLANLDGEQQLRFRDVRRFGSVTFFPNAPTRDAFLNARLGPEPFDLSASYWRDVLAKTRRCLKAVMLDQRAVAGVGNIYADESLFIARLAPTQLGMNTSGTEADRLRKAMARVLTSAIERRGSSIRDYVGGSGLQGGFQKEFSVYGRANQPCQRCRTLIARIRLAGRSTHFCPKCQLTRPH